MKAGRRNRLPHHCGHTTCLWWRRRLRLRFPGLLIQLESYRNGGDHLHRLAVEQGWLVASVARPVQLEVRKR